MMRVSWTRALALLLLLVAASGCASLGSAPLIATNDNLVWDCGWRPWP
jgi:hypothetical protein